MFEYEYTTWEISEMINGDEYCQIGNDYEDYIMLEHIDSHEQAEFCRDSAESDLWVIL